MNTLRQTRRRRRSIHQDDDSDKRKAPAIEPGWRVRREGEESCYRCRYPPCAGCSRRGGGDMGHWPVGQVEAGAGRAPEAEVPINILDKWKRVYVGNETLNVY